MRSTWWRAMKLDVGVGIIVDADGEDGQVGHVVVKLEQRGISSMQGAHSTPPEVEQDDLAAIARRDGLVVVPSETVKSGAGLPAARDARRGCSAEARASGRSRTRSGNEETAHPYNTERKGEDVMREATGPGESGERTAGAWKPVLGLSG